MPNIDDLSISDPGELSFGEAYINIHDASEQIVDLTEAMRRRIQATFWLGAVEPRIGYIENPPFLVPFVQVAIAAPWANWNTSIESLREDIRALRAQVSELRSEIHHLRERRTFVVPITSLPIKTLRLIEHIPATIEGDGEDFTATFTEANIGASGETEADALANLKDMLVATYEILAETPANRLGPIPSRQWSILKGVMESKE